MDSAEIQRAAKLCTKTSFIDLCTFYNSVIMWFTKVLLGKKRSL